MLKSNVQYKAVLGGEQIYHRNISYECKIHQLEEREVVVLLIAVHTLSNFFRRSRIALKTSSGTLRFVVPLSTMVLS